MALMAEQASTEHPPPPLSLLALLGQAHDTLEARFNEQLVTSEFADLTAALSRNVLRWVSATDCRASQLALASGVSKQALSLQIAQLERTGYITTGPDPADARAKKVILTDQGRRAQALVRRIAAEVDDEWHERLGDGWDTFEQQLRRIVDSRHPSPSSGCGAADA